MALLNSTRSAQYPLVAEFSFTFADTIVGTDGLVKSFGDVGTDVFEMIPLPPGATVLDGEIVVNVAFVGGTVTTLQIGDSASATRYSAAVDLQTLGRTALTPTGFVGNGENLRGTFIDTVAASTAGKATVRVTYTMAGRSQEVIIK